MYKIISRKLATKKTLTYCRLKANSAVFERRTRLTVCAEQQFTSLFSGHMLTTRPNCSRSGISKDHVILSASRARQVRLGCVRERKSYVWLSGVTRRAAAVPGCAALVSVTGCSSWPSRRGRFDELKPADRTATIDGGVGSASVCTGIEYGGVDSPLWLRISSRSHLQGSSSFKSQGVGHSSPPFEEGARIVRDRFRKWPRQASSGFLAVAPGSGQGDQSLQSESSQSFGQR